MGNENKLNLLLGARACLNAHPLALNWLLGESLNYKHADINHYCIQQHDSHVINNNCYLVFIYNYGRTSNWMCLFSWQLLMILKTIRESSPIHERDSIQLMHTLTKTISKNAIATRNSGNFYYKKHEIRVINFEMPLQRWSKKKTEME